MVYVLPREGGYADCTASDLRWASDAVADADVAQMMAFLQQTPDVPDLLNRGDLCFIWLWERREGTERGIRGSMSRLSAHRAQKAIQKLKNRGGQPSALATPGAGRFRYLTCLRAKNAERGRKS
jgi:hypothetical protein